MKTLGETILPWSIIIGSTVLVVSLIFASLHDLLREIYRPSINRLKNSNPKTRHRNTKPSWRLTAKQLTVTYIYIFSKAWRAILFISTTRAILWLIGKLHLITPAKLRAKRRYHDRATMLLPSNRSVTKVTTRRSGHTTLLPTIFSLIVLVYTAMALSFSIGTGIYQPFILIWGIISLWTFIVVTLYEPLTLRQKLPLFAALFVGYFIFITAAITHLISSSAKLFAQRT